MEAVGTPEEVSPALMKANLDEAVDTPPRRRSTERDLGEIAPALTFQLVPPTPVQLPHTGASVTPP